MNSRNTIAENLEFDPRHHFPDGDWREVDLKPLAVGWCRYHDGEPTHFVGLRYRVYLVILGPGDDVETFVEDGEINNYSGVTYYGTVLEDEMIARMLVKNGVPEVDNG